MGSILVDFLGFGVVMATVGWWIANKYLKDGTPAHSVDQVAIDHHSLPSIGTAVVTKRTSATVRSQ